MRKSFFVVVALLGLNVEAQVVPLTLEQARDLALLQNMEIEAGRLGYESAQRLFAAERAAVFEPTLGLNMSYERNERENTAEQFIAQGVPDFEERNRIYNTAIEQPLPTGGRISLLYNLRDLRNNLREQRELEGPEREFEAFFGLSFVQPLLRDGWPAVTLAAMRLAREESEVSFQQWRRQLMQTLASTEASYWDLYLAQQRVSLRQDSIRVAEQILEDNRARVETGRMSEIEIRRAEAGLALRRAQLSEAVQARLEASARLKSFFAELIEADDFILHATDEPLLEQLSLDQRMAHDMALALHPEYLSRIHLLEQDNLRVVFARNQMWPQVDFVATYGYNGLGDSAADAWSSTNDRDFNSWSVGVQFRVPLGGNIRGRNELSAARKRAEQGLLALESAGVELGNQLLTSWQRVQNQFQQAGDFGTVLEMNQALLDLELTRLDLGQSDSRQVLEVEEQVTESRESLYAAMSRYMVAKLELELANGAFLVNRSADPMSTDVYRDRLPAERRPPAITPEMDPFRQPVPRGTLAPTMAAADDIEDIPVAEPTVPPDASEPAPHEPAPVPVPEPIQPDADEAPAVPRTPGRWDQPVPRGRPERTPLPEPIPDPLADSAPGASARPATELQQTVPRR